MSRGGFMTRIGDLVVVAASVAGGGVIMLAVVSALAFPTKDEASEADDRRDRTSRRRAMLSGSSKLGGVLLERPNSDLLLSSSLRVLSFDGAAD